MKVLLLITVLNKLNTQVNITDVTLFTSLQDLFVFGDDLKVQLSLGIPYYHWLSLLSIENVSVVRGC